MSRILYLTDGPAAPAFSFPLFTELRKAKHIIRAVPTDSACLLLNIFGWAAIAGSPAKTFTQLADEDWDWPELILLAPASANFLGSLAASPWRERLEQAKSPVLVLPALLANDDQQAAAAQIRANLPANCQLLLPQKDTLGLGALGTVALASTRRCLLACRRALTKQDLAGQRLLLTAGPTIEDIDPVRFVSNRSTGRMGLALAEAAFCRGAEVTVVHGPLPALDFPAFPDRLRLVPVRSAKEMYEAVIAAIPQCDIAVLCAAVADYAPSSCAAQKIKKQPDEALHLCLERTPDILAALGNLPEPRPFLVGFAAESNDLEENAALKLKTKHCDLICANNISEPGCGFAVSTNRVTIFFQDGTPALELPLLSKDETASRILDQVVKRLPTQ